MFYRTQYMNKNTYRKDRRCTKSCCGCPDMRAGLDDPPPQERGELWVQVFTQPGLVKHGIEKSRDDNAVVGLYLHIKPLRPTLHVGCLSPGHCCFLSFPDSGFRSSSETVVLILRGFKH